MISVSVRKLQWANRPVQSTIDFRVVDSLDLAIFERSHLSLRGYQPKVAEFRKIIGIAQDPGGTGGAEGLQ
jgi:hypothetical protein